MQKCSLTLAIFNQTGSGADAVQVNMTNSLLTDPEILETRFPVRVQRMEIRSNSGGKGQFRGGNGILRELIFLEDMEVSMISQFRETGPSGLLGGKNGSQGKNYLKSGKILDGCFQIQIPKGESLIVETPGGGGYGKI